MGLELGATNVITVFLLTKKYLKTAAWFLDPAYCVFINPPYYRFLTETGLHFFSDQLRFP